MTEAVQSSLEYHCIDEERPQSIAIVFAEKLYSVTLCQQSSFFSATGETPGEINAATSKHVRGPFAPRYISATLQKLPQI